MIENIKKYYPLLLTIGIVVLGVMLFQTNATLKQERLDREYQKTLDSKNFDAVKDSITKDYNKKLEAWEFTQDNIVVQHLEELEKYNNELKIELEKVKGDLIAALNSEVKGDLGGLTTSGDSIKLLDPLTNHYGISFKSIYKDQGFEQRIVGMSKFYVEPDTVKKLWTFKPDMTILDTNITRIKITYGFKDYKNRYQVFALTKSPKIQLLDLTGGYFIDKQPPPPPTRLKKWGVGPYFGYGVVSNSNINSAGFGFSAGIAVHYDLFQW